MRTAHGRDKLPIPSKSGFSRALYVQFTERKKKKKISEPGFSLVSADRVRPRPGTSLPPPNCLLTLQLVSPQQQPTVTAAVPRDIRSTTARHLETGMGFFYVCLCKVEAGTNVKGYHSTYSNTSSSTDWGATTPTTHPTTTGSHSLSLVCVASAIWATPAL